MSIPNLKRIRATNATQLSAWLASQDTSPQEVMLVTHTDANPDKHFSLSEVHASLADHGWQPGRRYTLNATLIGHVISR